MSLATASVPADIINTILVRLAQLFLAGTEGDLLRARVAAAQMLAAYHPGSEQELYLAADIISFSCHALEALAQAAAPDITLNHQLRLRSGAVSLNRQVHKAQRRLDQLQKARQAGLSDQPLAEPLATASPNTTAAEPTPRSAEPAPPPRVEKAIALVEETRDAMAGKGKYNGLPWTQAFAQREREKRLAARRAKEAVRQATQKAVATPTPATATPAAF